MTQDWVKGVIAREERAIPLPDRLGRVLVTGADGSIGTAIQEKLFARARTVMATDTDMDVRDIDEAWKTIASFKPDVILHLAGAKHAPEGEIDPYGTMITNTVGTRNILRAANGCKVVVASTCKACDPETSYGASKLLAERMALNAEAVVVRYYNVVETSGNVFSIWSEMDGLAIPVAASCERIFITAQEAVDLTLWACSAPSGRYVLDGVTRRRMGDVAADLYPNRLIEWIPPRRGDRLIEPHIARCETIYSLGNGVAQVVSPYDHQVTDPGTARIDTVGNHATT